jgi:ATP-dependent DNA helicase PIF1
MSEEVNYASLESEIQEIAPERPVPCERLIGCAGTGKTFQLQKRTQEDPSYGLLSSTTGISAVNLGAITVHSTLRYSTTEVLRDIFISGRLQRILHSIALKFRRLIIEEYSMSDAEQLDLWYRGVQEANRYADVIEPMGLLLAGDLAQLAPVKAKWCFEANCWSEFADNTTRLETVYRQEGGPFLDALNLLRVGQGGPAMEVLSQAGVTWHTCIDTEFDGTTIFSMNDKVNRYNNMMLDEVKGKRVAVTSRRWGKQRNEWNQNPRTKEWGIPPEQDFKIGALVVITSNRRDFTVVNGDGGHIVSYDPESENFTVNIIRTGKDEVIQKIIRHCDQMDEPEGWSGEKIPANEDQGAWIPRPHFRSKQKTYVLGQIEYLPMKLNYASTVHKSQSLTLDRTQVDFRDWFFGQPAMLYTALSRCRTLTGLRLVGIKEKFVKQCSIDKRILPWL